ncbi:MAG: hypothetical protein OXE02_00680 [Chloroflexi bacterium]|nr:hypothetical protein [Chloroflexota bacterium]
MVAPPDATAVSPLTKDTASLHSHGPPNLPLGYVDEFLSRWFLDCIERNDSDAMKKLFIVDSETVRAGSGELRA